MKNKFGKLVEKYDQEHYFLGYDRTEKHAGFYCLSFDGLELAISPSSLETLRGKCLSIQQVARLDDPSHSREILVAMPIDDATQQT